MQRLIKITALILSVAVLCYISFRIGESRANKVTFERGVKLAKQTSALYRAADSNLLVILSDAGKNDKVRGILENGMWISIIPMDELLRNPDASEDDKKSVNIVLPKLVEYYYKNPKVIEAPPRSEVSDRVSNGLKAEAKSSGGDLNQKEVLGQLGEASKEPLKELDGMFDSYLSEEYKFNLKTQAVLDRHIAQRNFPGRAWSGAGMTFMMPPDTGGGGSSDEEFHYNGKKIRVLYEGDRLLVDGKDFGVLTKSDTVDLRLLGRVFVNNLERHTVTQEEVEQAEPSNGDKPSN